MTPTPADPAPCHEPDPRGAWARFAGDECDWELRDGPDEGSEDGRDGPGEGGGTLELSSLAISASAPVRGPVPPSCREHTCVYHGVSTSAGPLVLAVVPSLDSEMPSDVLLGFVHGDRLVFTSLWEDAGDPVQSDFTRVGPAHALAPFVRGEALALRVVERLDAAGAAIPEPLRAREGRLDPADPSVPAGPVDVAECRAVELPVP